MSTRPASSLLPLRLERALVTVDEVPVGRARKQRDAFGQPALAASDEGRQLSDDPPAPSDVDEAAEGAVSRVVRGLFIALFLLLAVAGVLGGLGVLGRPDGAADFGVAAAGLLFAFIVWKRAFWSSMGDSILDLFTPW